MLEQAGWEGTQYQFALNRYLLDLYRDEVPETVYDVGMFVEERGFLVGQSGEIAQRVLDALRAELGV